MPPVVARGIGAAASSTVFVPQRQHDPSLVAGVVFLSLLLPLCFSFSLFLSLSSLLVQETDPWRDQCSTVHGASPPWDEAATSPPSGGTICVVPNQQVPSTALLPGLPRPPLNTMAAASISPASSAACQIVRTRSTTSVRLLHGGILLPSGISGKVIISPDTITIIAMLVLPLLSIMSRCLPHVKYQPLNNVMIAFNLFDLANH
ncbi:uncharacterized protein LOC123440467 isoform X1 [Hordeum vulgare subsp. vulgare]|uniref:uncharacterized protein LOC123440467 isoform X1 n=1 Tax=Hordeum vulgare subsp. vulgare TaxID=112509 RepID=UPI001D1A5AE9|nr:uncharacterized protein LOC123440467 isoform X1 [Hordeum vulgare subsp. vulgare]